MFPIFLIVQASLADFIVQKASIYFIVDVDSIGREFYSLISLRATRKALARLLL